MSSAGMTYRDEESGLEFRWHGGAYIDIGRSYAMGEPGIDGDENPACAGLFRCGASCAIAT